MLIHLSVSHLALVEKLELSFSPGMTVFTGETGAGKSVLIEALGLALGDRADSQMIRRGFEQAEICVLYDIRHLPGVQKMLKEQGLEDAEHHCLIRRLISREAASRAFVNGHLASVNQIRLLGEALTVIHGQHQHQSLLRSEHQRFLLDDFANHADLLNTVSLNYQQHQKIFLEYEDSLKIEKQGHQINLLEYQLQEIEALNLQPQELEELEKLQRELTHSKEWIENTEHILNRLKNNSESSEQDALSILHQALEQITRLNKQSQSKVLEDCAELLNGAVISLEESIEVLRNFQEHLSLDPKRLFSIEQRLNDIYTLARKYRIQSNELLDYQKKLNLELKNLQILDADRQGLEKKLKEAYENYQKSAVLLSASRKKSALMLEKNILKTLIQLAMPHAVFKIKIASIPDGVPALTGMDQVEFEISLNPGLPLQPLKKVSSGGELSRISLAIQLITAKKMTTPTLVFDEADSGISGQTAAIVGQLLRKLAAQTQVFCVTHLPQVAVQGHQHYRIFKEQTKNNTVTVVEALDEKARTEEIARILGGSTMTASGLEHAKAMLAEVV